MDLLASRNAQSSRESEMEVAGESVLGLNPSSPSVLVSCDGYNKLLHPGRHKTADVHSLTVLAARSLKSGCAQSPTPSKGSGDGGGPLLAFSSF